MMLPESTAVDPAESKQPESNHRTSEPKNDASSIPLSEDITPTSDLRQEDGGEDSIVESLEEIKQVEPPTEETSEEPSDSQPQVEVTSTEQPEHPPPENRNTDSRSIDSKIIIAEQGRRISELEARLAGLDSGFRELSTQNHQLLIQMNATLDSRDEIEKDNAALRTEILRLREPPGQDYNDDVYFKNLNELNEVTQLWVAAMFKGPTKRVLDAEAEIKLRNALNHHRVGESILQVMHENRCTIQKLFQHSITRIVFVRQLIAIFLCSEVFGPFCLGTPQELDTPLRKTMEIVINAEQSVTKVLTVRQTIGKALLYHHESTQKATRDDLIVNLEEILRLLLPIPRDIKPKVRELVKRAIQIAHLITCEQALFNCDLCQGGSQFKGDVMYLPDENQRGRVFMCTFPYFGKRLLQNGHERPHCLFPASVELESILREFA